MRSLFSQLQHAYSDSRPDSPTDYSSAFHFENPVFLKDLGANYFGYFNHDKNLLLDVFHQSTILDTLRENQLEKTSFPGGPPLCAQPHKDRKQAKNPKASGGGSDDDMCYVCGHGDDEEDNKIVYCEVRLNSLSFNPHSLAQSVCMPNAMASREISKPATGIAASAKLSKVMTSSRLSVLSAATAGEPCAPPTSHISFSLSFRRV